MCVKDEGVSESEKYDKASDVNCEAANTETNFDDVYLNFLPLKKKCQNIFSPWIEKR